MQSTNEQLSYTSRTLTHHNKPFLPMMGEFHYSRYPQRHWQRELAKIKAGGVNILASYVIWIHHEEQENSISFDNNLDIRYFINLVSQAGMKMFLRIGPWVHGEVRNGGLPDWVLQKNYKPRTNDDNYFADVRKFYTAIFEQVDGFFHHQDGPIIGIQIENEYGHCGGLQGKEGEVHIQSLYQIAQDIGFSVPYWTATGWGGAITAGLLPVMGGYPDAPWDPRLTEIEPSTNFVFSPQRNDHAIGSDHHNGGNLTFDPSLYPYLTAELGGGLQVTAHRRPIVTAQDVEAMSIAKLGSGASLLGYYMYHGGRNPKGKLTTLQESKATGYPNDLPIFNYDFNAPLGEYGQPRESYQRLRRIGLFIQDFGSALADMSVTFPLTNPEDPSNSTTLRYTQRDNGKSGFIFVNNYQRRQTMASHPNTIFTAQLTNEKVTFPPINVSNGDSFFLPFNLDIDGHTLKSTNAIPLCTLQTTDGIIPVFYTDDVPIYNWEGQPPAKVITLNKADSLLATRIHSSVGEHLLLYNGLCYQNNGCYWLESTGPAEICVYPPLPKIPAGYTLSKGHEDFSVYTLDLPFGGINVRMSAPQYNKHDELVHFITLSYSGAMAGAILHINAIYNTARLFINGELVDDSFYTGQLWSIDLEHFAYPSNIEIRFVPLHKNDPVYLERWPDMDSNSICKLFSVSALPIHISPLSVG